MSLFKDKDGKPRKLGCWVKILIGIVAYVALYFLFSFVQEQLAIVRLDAHSVYRIDLKGTLVEQGQEPNPMTELLATLDGNAKETIGLNDLLDNIRLAKESEKVEGIYLRGGSLAVGQASAKAIRDALLDFKSSGKWIVAYADRYSQSNYYICSVADKIYLNAIGEVDWKGLCAEKMYFTRILENIGVEMQIIKVGTFKSAVEPYFRTSMSEADRLQTEKYVGGVWNILKEGVSESRGIAVETLDEYADMYMGLQRSEKMVECGLVDSLCYIQDMDSVLTQIAGTTDYVIVNHSKMCEITRPKNKAKDKIAILYAEGEITDESGDGIVGKKMVRTIRKIERDNDVKAVVLRVNSPGGSADASEQIWHAMTTLQAKGLPVVVSMGDYAASGGYYISSEADYIFAEPNTLTGSIGIFGTVPCWAKLRDKIGLDIDILATNKHSDLESNMLMKGMNEEEYQLMQQMVENGYDLFTRRCAAGRHTSQDSIKAIAEGRVWLGVDALKIGLVDSLGNIDDAIAKAAELAGVETYKTSVYPERKDFVTELLEMLNNTTPEERLVARIRAFASRPRLMTRMDEVVIK